MPKPTPAQIKSEIAALRALVPNGRFAEKTAAGIAIQIEELTSHVDDTADEWNDLTDGEREAAIEARRWKEGWKGGDIPPSKSWANLVK